MPGVWVQRCNGSAISASGGHSYGSVLRAWKMEVQDGDVLVVTNTLCGRYWWSRLLIQILYIVVVVCNDLHCDDSVVVWIVASSLRP